MNEAEIIKKIAEQKQQRAKDLKIDQGVEFLLFGQANAKYWASWMNNQPSAWVEKLFELLKFKSIKTFDEGEGDKSLDCKEFVFFDHKFTFKISAFRGSWWDSTDDARYADLYMYYGDELVASFGLIEDYHKHGDYSNQKVVSIDSFIEGDWVNQFKEFVANANLFYHWEKDDRKRKAIAAEAIVLKSKFGITDEEISSVSTAIEKLVEPEVKIKEDTPLNMDFDRLNEKKKAYDYGMGFANWIKANPKLTIAIGAGIFLILINFF
uniref:hypothetical protein n=1 Tax=Polynucleobacter sp. TaxID=2029855 RepID=UPI0040488185